MKKILLFLFILMIPALVYADDFVPVILGTATDNGTAADGSVVTVCPQGIPEDNITDTVGAAGLTAQSGYFKLNLNNLATELNNGDIVAIYMTDSIKETTMLWRVDTSSGVNEVSLDYNTALNDYDSDTYTGDVDCNDNNANINPGAAEICGNSIDDNCDGNVDEGCGGGTTTTTTSGGGGGGGGGCYYNWNCTEWTACQPDRKQARTCENLGSCSDSYNTPITEQDCTYTAPTAGTSGQSAGSTAETQPEVPPAGDDTQTEESPPGEETQPQGLAGITGAAIANLGKPPVYISMIVIAAIGTFIFFARKKIFK